VKTLINDPEVDVFGTAFGPTGWTTHSMCFARSLDKRVPVSFRTSTGSQLAQLMTGARSMAWRGMRNKARSFGVVISGRPFPGQLSARWNVWETTRLPEHEQELCETTTFVWTPSSWGRRNLIANGIEPNRIAVVPEGVDVDFFRPEPRARTGPFRFLFVGKWETRKFVDGLVRAFADEFSAREDVELVLHAHNVYVAGFSLKKSIAHLGIANHVKLRPSMTTTRTSLRKLYQSADCFVFPTRAEGWGLPILEAMACHVPAIVTRYGAPLDFVTEDNGYLLDVEHMVDARCETFSIDTGQWAEPDSRHLRFLMRQAFENPRQVREKGAVAGRDAQRFSWDNSSRIALDTIGEALGSTERAAVRPRVPSELSRLV